jgi:Stress responsive A/B Barrel Domain
MIRNVVMGRLRPDADPGLLDEGLAGLRALRVEGMVSLDCGRDAQLREGNWDYAITADFVDIGAYRRYDDDEEHNRLRREAFGPVSEQIVRVQFTVG